MTPIYVLLGVVVALCAYIAWRLTTRSADDPAAELMSKLEKNFQDSRLKDREHLQQRIDHLQKILTENTRASSETMQKQFAQSASIIKQVTEKLTALDRTNQQVVNFSEQLKDLQSILQNPKGKGVLSEYWLETMLSHVLQPEQYKMQYKFNDGEIVDAAIFYQNKIIPIDAKFSSNKYNDLVKENDPKRRDALEKSFRGDLKLRIDETSKYIRPEESTTDYAFMFIPAEGIYYDLLVQKVGATGVNQVNLIQYAHGKRVMIVSPNTFFAFLQTVIEGMRTHKVQESVQEILKRVGQLGKHLNTYEDYMKKMGNHLGTTVSMYNQAYGAYKLIDKDVYKLTEGKEGGNVEALQLEKPTADAEEKMEAVTAANIRKQR